MSAMEWWEFKRTNLRTGEVDYDCGAVWGFDRPTRFPSAESAQANSANEIRLSDPKRYAFAAVKVTRRKKGQPTGRVVFMAPPYLAAREQAARAETWREAAEAVRTRIMGMRDSQGFDAAMVGLAAAFDDHARKAEVGRG